MKFYEINLQNITMSGCVSILFKLIIYLKIYFCLANIINKTNFLSSHQRKQILCAEYPILSRKMYFNTRQFLFLSLNNCTLTMLATFKLSCVTCYRL